MIKIQITPQGLKKAVLQGRIDVLESRLDGHDCDSPSPHTCKYCFPIHLALGGLYRELSQVTQEHAM